MKDFGNRSIEIGVVLSEKLKFLDETRKSDPPGQKRDQRSVIRASLVKDLCSCDEEAGTATLVRPRRIV